MQELQKYICKDLLPIIGEYVNGDKQYWKSQFSSCMNELKLHTFFHVRILYRGVDYGVVNKLFLIRASRENHLSTAINEFADDLFQQFELQTDYNFKDYYKSILSFDINFKKNNFFDKFNTIDVISPLFF